MLPITIPGVELYDEKNGEFVKTKDTTIHMEHSLISLSKWEEKWNKPFFSKEEKTYEETIDYFRCMTLTQNVDPNIYNCLTNENVEEIKKYIDAPMTATTFSKREDSKFNREIITAEIIYYWMISLQIPVEFQKWHLNKLLTLIRVCNVKNQPPKKRSRRDILSSNSAINAARRKQMNTKG